jgi:hypothetical protein
MLDMPRSRLTRSQIPPRVTFSAQMIATLVSTLICTGIIKFQVRLSVVPSHPSVRR